MQCGVPCQIKSYFCSLTSGVQVMGDTGGMTAPDARVAFLDAVMDPGDVDYTVEDMTNPLAYMPIMAQAFPMYLKRLQVRSFTGSCFTWVAAGGIDMHRLALLVFGHDDVYHLTVCTEHHTSFHCVSVHLRAACASLCT